LTAPQHGGDDPVKISADSLAVAHQMPPQDLVVFALFVETLPPRVQRVNSVETGQDNDFPRDLAERGLRGSSQQRLRSQEAESPIETPRTRIENPLYSAGR